MQFKLKKSYILCSLALCVTGNAYAAADTITADAVVVSANRVTQDLLDASNSISVVNTEKAIKTGANTIPDLLKEVPAVSIQSDGTPGIKRVSIRGESAQRTVISVDGQRIDDHKTKSGAPFLINPYFIDSLEVIKGPASVLYGSDAIGGLVSVKTKEASDKAFEGEFGTQYSTHANAFSSFFNATGTLNDFRYALGTFYTHQNDMYLADHEKLDNTSFNSKGTNVKLEYDLTSNFSVGYGFEYFDTESRTATTVEDPGYKYYRAHMPEWKRIKHSVFAEATDLAEGVSKIRLSAYTQSNDKDFDSAVTPKFGPFVRAVNNQKASGVNLQAEFEPSSTTSLVMGYDGKFEKLDADTFANIPPAKMQMSFLDNGYKQDTHAVYALLTQEITDDLMVNAGFRWNKVDSEVGMSNMVHYKPGGNLVVPISKYAGYTDQSTTKTVGSAGLVYKLTDHNALRFNWSQGFRTPGIQELFLSTMAGGAAQNGNPNLKPETSNNFEIGYRFDNRTGTLVDWSIFYQKSEDYIDTVIVPPGPKPSPMKAFTFQNISEATAYGAEISFAYKTGDFTPYFNLSYTEREYQLKNFSTKDTGTPKFQGVLGMKYDTSYEGVDLRFDPNLRFASSTKLNDEYAPKQNIGLSHLGSYEYSGYVTVNATVTAAFGADKQYQVYASVENLLDKKYQTTELIEEPGRFFVVGGSAKF